MAIIDKANAFYLRPLPGDTAQEESHVLDFGAAELGGENNLAGYLVVNTSAAQGSVKLQDSENGRDFADVAGSTITVTAAGEKHIVMPKHRRYVKAVLTTLTAENTDVYIGALPYKK